MRTNMKRHVAPQGPADSRIHGQGQASPLAAGVGEGFVSETSTVNGTTIHYVRGGEGPPIVLIHGFPQDWFEYHAIMPRLAKRFTVIAVDLRGIGGSTPTDGGYDAATMAQDVYQLVSALRLERVYMVGHDIGGQVAYAFVRHFPQVTRGAMVLDSPISGIEGLDEIAGDPRVWHGNFHMIPDLPEALVAGRQEIYFRYFFDIGTRDGRGISDADLEHYAHAHADPAQLRAAFEMYRAFPANLEFNTVHHGPNDVPLFLAAGEGSPFAPLIPTMVDDLRAKGFAHVESAVIPESVHYLVEDQPDAVADLIVRYASRHENDHPPARLAWPGRIIHRGDEAQTMLTNALVCATVPTTDLQRARRFYGETLGLEETRPPEGEHGVYYRAGRGTMLTVYERPGAAAEHTVATFVVDNLKEVMTALRGRGVAFEEYDSPGLKTENGVYSEPNGFEVAWVRDPDGNILSIEQLPSA